MARTNAGVVVIEAPSRPAALARLRAPRVSRRTLLPAAIFAVALAFDLYRLGAPSLWMDEAFSVQLARQPLSVLYSAFISGGEPNMILYHLLLHGWLALGALFGIPASEFFVRFPSAIFAALSTLVLFLLGRRFLNTWAGLVGAALYTLTGLVLTAAQETRAYSLELLLICVTWYALLTVLQRDTRPLRWWGIFVGGSVLVVYSHAFSMLLLLAQMVAFGLLLLLDTSWRARARRHLTEMLIALAAIVVLIAPFLYASRHGAKNGWLPAPQIGALLSRVTSVALKSKLSLAVLAALVTLAVAALILSRLPVGRRVLSRLRSSSSPSAASAALQINETLPILVALACWLLIPTVVSYVLSQGPVRLFSSRYLVTVVPAACLLVGAGTALVRGRAVRIALGVGIVCAALVTVPGYYAHAQVEDWRTPTRWLEARYQPGDGLVAYNNVQGCELPVDYYLQTDDSPAHFTADAPGVIDLARYGHGDPFAGFSNALHPDALAAYAAKHPRLFYIEGRFTDDADAARAHAAQHWLDTRYRFLAQVSTGVVTIRLYDTTQPPLPAPASLPGINTARDI